MEDCEWLPASVISAHSFQIASLGGQVTLQPDTAITHVIHDKASASIVCNQLGIRTLSELPQGTLCVKWEYVASCKIAVSVAPVCAAYILSGQTAGSQNMAQLSRDYLDTEEHFENDDWVVSPDRHL